RALENGQYQKVNMKLCLGA
ncbi:hypothetical protein CEXT_580291, partial [Caerostris extrusa]